MLMYSSWALMCCEVDGEEVMIDLRNGGEKIRPVDRRQLASLSLLRFLPEFCAGRSSFVVAASLFVAVVASFLVVAASLLVVAASLLVAVRRYELGDLAALVVVARCHDPISGVNRLTGAVGFMF
ncbi:uncharacterized protein B0I36DRAFT_430034 [Microdochium trichocladiopsis]|uniref:Uncharacterized protein n=1 Tax=Microdochium trichocladiopsis TaxID=1682393 RepID=A0A9P8Y7I1_9PEZI|nr:uncharacterized protein B0I36DRAFT_430034 [Microdochium trichocladiopsis]KAH7032599.1 hypothetical protein B0I36DRAFT_430034 [Microdochium trichocladiopsis]